MSRLDRLTSGLTWAEGPVWFGDHACLLFSDIPSQRILRWSQDVGVSVFRARSGFNNGNTRDRQGRLVGCRHGPRDVVRTEHDGALTVLARDHGGGRLNSPNDVVVSSDGAIWFTDPKLWHHFNFEGCRAPAEQTARHVFRIDPDSGAVAPVVSDFVQPNGLAFSVDETRLYIAESGSSHDASVPSVIRQFDVAGATLRDAEILPTLDCGLPDGLRVDLDGNVWSSAGDRGELLRARRHAAGQDPGARDRRKRLLRW